jgi:uncharacterized membrane-anchored protein
LNSGTANGGASLTVRHIVLAALSRELGINDWQRDAETAAVDGKRGALNDRNVELLIRAPFPVA